MAGDWIKVEHATLDKPEVLRTAEMLGVSRDTAVGLFFRFWVWLDKNLSGNCPDFVRNVSRKGLDEFMHCPGFAACLESVGWAEFDDSTWTMRVVNADRHNGNTAKNRALDNKRKAENRVREMSGSEPDKSRTREEKRREEKSDSTPVEQSSTPLTATSIHGTRLDPNWVLPADWVEWTLRERPDFVSADVERVALVFRDHWHSKAGKDARKTDWFKTWCNWIRREQRHYSKRPDAISERREKQARNMDILTGKVRDERTIEGFAERVGGAVVLSLPGGVREPCADDVEGSGPGRSAAGMGRVPW